MDFAQAALYNSLRFAQQCKKADTLPSCEDPRRLRAAEKNAGSLFRAQTDVSPLF